MLTEDANICFVYFYIRVGSLYLYNLSCTILLVTGFYLLFCLFNLNGVARPETNHSHFSLFAEQKVNDPQGLVSL